MCGHFLLVPTMILSEREKEGLSLTFHITRSRFHKHHIFMVTCFITIIYVMFGHFLLVQTMIFSERKKEGLSLTFHTTRSRSHKHHIYMVSCFITIIIIQVMCGHFLFVPTMILSERKKDSLLHFTS